MQRTEKYLRETIKKDIEILAPRVFKDLAMKIMEAFITRECGVEIDLSDVSPVKHEEYRKLTLYGRFKWNFRGAFRDDIVQIIEEELAIHMKNIKPEPKTRRKGAKSEKA